MSREWLVRFLPQPNTAGGFEQMRACAGALFGLMLTGLLSYSLLGRASATAYLIAPMGASAVLLFCVPASPLAQPWSIIGGNLVSALIGVTCAKLFVDAPLLAAALAGCLAIGAMFSLRCLHPPSGAVALTAVLGG
ncbi:MAG: HPP family protein [Burkholderiaceae bacterium]